MHIDVIRGDREARLRRREVPDDESARVAAAFEPRVPDKEQRGRTPTNLELNELGMDIVRGTDIVDQLARVDSPTLVVVGELDPVTPVAGAEKIVAALPEGLAQLEIIEGGGHFTWMRRPMIIEFIHSTAAGERVVAAS